jgi:hypothetical protein
MVEAKPPINMRLGEIVREISTLTAVKVLAEVMSPAQAYARAPLGCGNPRNLVAREDALYSELNDRDSERPEKSDDKWYYYNCENCGNETELREHKPGLRCESCSFGYTIRPDK